MGVQKKDNSNLINFVLESFRISVNDADSKRTKNLNEKDSVRKLNQGALDLLSEYSQFTDDREVNAVFNVLSDMQKYSPVTFGHSIVTSFIAMELLVKMDHSRYFIHNQDFWELYKGYLMHDIGKLDLSLRKYLNSSESSISIRKRLRKHAKPIIISKMMKHYLLESKGIVKIASAHHLRPDGTGYPKCDEIILEDVYTEIASLADVIEAIMYNLVTNRVYKRDSTFEDLLRILKSISGKQIESNICNLGIGFISDLISNKINHTKLEFVTIS